MMGNTSIIIVDGQVSNIEGAVRGCELQGTVIVGIK